MPSILWIKDFNHPPSAKNIEVYRFCRVPFGVITSPFLLQATIEHILHRSELPIANEIVNSKYMDNIFFGARETSEAVKKYQEIKHLFQPDGMTIREFQSNSLEFLESIPTADWDPSVSPKFLGIKWDTKRDIFEFSMPKVALTENITKRDVLSSLAHLFDPLGILEPIRVRGKLFFQKL